MLVSPSRNGFSLLCLRHRRRHFSTISDLPPLSHLPSIPSHDHLRQAHAQLVLLGHAASRAAIGHLIAACALSSAADPDYCFSLYRQVDRPNVFVNNNFIRCLARSHHPKQSLQFYSQTRKLSMPTNNYTFPFLLQACSRNPLLLEGSQVHCHVIKLGHDRDLFVRNALIHFYNECLEMGKSRSVFDEWPDQRDVVTWNAIIAGYARTGETSVAEELFDVMPVRDTISWSTVIMGFVQSADLEKALWLFKEMVAQGVAVNEATLVTILSATAQLGLVEQGCFVHETIKTLKLPVSVAIGTALVDMYAKCGAIDIARCIFDEMPQKDVFAWNVMICGLAVHGLAKEALELFKKFLSEDLHPTNITFVGVLNACSRVGLVDKGWSYFNSMVTDYGIEPEMEHYGCMVDLLARAGRVSEALELVKGMKIAPDPVLWGTLLGACKIHGLVELGIEVGNKLIRLEPNHDGHYVLLAGMYAKANKWDDVHNVRRLMVSHGTNKVAGWSLIEACGTVHRFVAGDIEHKRFVEINRMLETIERRLAAVGYSPDTSPVLHDIGEEEKMNTVRQHSERLAIAFGLMVIEITKPIRIVKNLRVCGDCHEFSKKVSQEFKREIIVRDGSRFHHFKEGECSCMDFW